MDFLGDTAVYMNVIVCRSIGAVIAAFALIAVLAFVTDTTLQLIGVLPETGARKFELKEALLALFYHLGYVVLGGYSAARLAPSQPMAHALALGALGVAVSALGLIAIIMEDLAPAWYGWVLVLLSVPASWAGGKLYVLS